MHVKQANAVDLIQDALQIHGVSGLIRRSFERLFLRRRNGNSEGFFHALWGADFCPIWFSCALASWGLGFPWTFGCGLTAFSLSAGSLAGGFFMTASIRRST